MKLTINKDTRIGWSGSPNQKLHISGECTVIGPHGENCGCRWFDKEGNKLNYMGLGCTNPTHKLKMK